MKVWTYLGAVVIFTALLLACGGDGNGDADKAGDGDKAGETPGAGDDGTTTVTPTDIIFTSDREGSDNFDLILMNADGTGQVAITDIAGRDLDPAWAHNGDKILFATQRDAHFEVYEQNPVSTSFVLEGRGDIRRTDQVRLTIFDPILMPRTLDVDKFPAWSAATSKIAFQSQRGGDWEIHVMESGGFDSGDAVNLTNDGSTDEEPDWSPDGSKIAFVSDRDDVASDIYVMNADGRDVVRLTEDPGYDGDPDWSPDGTKIAFATDRDGNDEIYVMDADGTNPTRITNNPANENVPDWSPDGTRFLFATDRDGDFEIYVMNVDGTGETRLTNNPATDTSPAWNPFK
jgi:Tol biopolymer transport system component